MTDWQALSADAAFASHRLIGWIYWDPVGIERYAALGVPDGFGYYVATRAAPLGVAGAAVVTAACYSILPAFVTLAVDLCDEHTTFAAAAQARDEAVVDGLRLHVPEVCDALAELADPLWAAVDAQPVAGRALFAAHQAWPRPDGDDLLSAWLAVNALREWRGDTHWAIHVAEGIDGTMAGVLDGAWRAYDGDWIPRSRGADDAALNQAYVELERRGLAHDGTVTEAGIVYRQSLEDRLDRLTIPSWQALGAGRTRALVELVGSVGERLMARVDDTAGPQWMPAGRTREHQT